MASCSWYYCLSFVSKGTSHRIFIPSATRKNYIMETSFVASRLAKVVHYQLGVSARLKVKKEDCKQLHDRTRSKEIPFTLNPSTSPASLMIVVILIPTRSHFPPHSPIPPWRNRACHGDPNRSVPVAWWGPSPRTNMIRVSAVRSTYVVSRGCRFVIVGFGV